MEAHADYDGPALTWGLTYKKASAAQCCQACKEVRRAGACGGRRMVGQRPAGTVAGRSSRSLIALCMAQLPCQAFARCLPQFQPQPDGQRCNVWVSCATV